MTRDQQKREEWVRSIHAKYWVSDAGRIRSDDHKWKSTFGVTTRRGRILKPTVNPSTGYPQVCLGRKTYFVHSLVAYAFCPGYATGLVVNHKNGDKTDNRAENLEWVSQGENISHAFRVLGRKSHLEGKLGALHPCAKAVVAISPEGSRRRFGSTREAVRAGFAKDPGSVTRCCQGKIATHNFYRWEYA